MSNVDHRLAHLALKRADIMIPHTGVDLSKWAVVACDQYTSEPEYWEQVAQNVGEAPSTLHLIYPEVYLEEADGHRRIETINRTMQSYLDQGLFTTYSDCFFLVHRTTDNCPQGRWGLLVTLDLEHYDYAKDSRTLIRATEGTILSRIPPRKEIRKNAPLELPHILVLINDPARSVIEPLAAKRESLTKAYDTELMANGGHIEGWVIDSELDMENIAAAVEAMYNTIDPSNPLLFAMGDGNHSLATAKSCWMDIKKTLSEDEIATHPARFAMVELENIYDSGLFFEPIHRVLFGLNEDTLLEEVSKVCDSFSKQTVSNVEEIVRLINTADGMQKFGFCDANGCYVLSMSGARANIAAGTLQVVIDSLLEQKKATVDYIHGVDVTANLGRKSGNIGLILPDVSKDTFFETIIRDNALPRKTFSMGEAHEKRFYLEARRIQR